jgi:hypothetical protein
MKPHHQPKQAHLLHCRPPVSERGPVTAAPAHNRTVLAGPGIKIACDLAASPPLPHVLAFYPAALSTHMTRIVRGLPWSEIQRQSMFELMGNCEQLSRTTSQEPQLFPDVENHNAGPIRSKGGKMSSRSISQATNCMVALRIGCGRSMAAFACLL